MSASALSRTIFVHAPSGAGKTYLARKGPYYSLGSRSVFIADADLAYSHVTHPNMVDEWWLGDHADAIHVEFASRLISYATSLAEQMTGAHPLGRYGLIVIMGNFPRVLLNALKAKEFGITFFTPPTCDLSAHARSRTASGGVSSLISASNLRWFSENIADLITDGSRKWKARLLKVTTLDELRFHLNCCDYKFCLSMPDVRRLRTCVSSDSFLTHHAVPEFRMWRSFPKTFQMPSRDEWHSEIVATRIGLTDGVRATLNVTVHTVGTNPKAVALENVATKLRMREYVHEDVLNSAMRYAQADAPAAPDLGNISALIPAYMLDFALTDEECRKIYEAVCFKAMKFGMGEQLSANPARHRQVAERVQATNKRKYEESLENM